METNTRNISTKGKVLIKGLIIGILALLLLIPAAYVQKLIEEREQRQKEAIVEVSSRWAGRQNIAGPVIVLPYWEYGSDTVKKVRIKHYAYFLPDELVANAVITPQEKHRGIYKVMLYTAKINLSGIFKVIQTDKLNIASENILWNEAYVMINISDTKGLNDELLLSWNNRQLTLTPNIFEDPSFRGGLSAPLTISAADDLKDLRFSASINLNGSEQLLITPTGKSRTVEIGSTWQHPSFTGDILPQISHVKNTGFTASWKSLSHKRKFPQQWKDTSYTFYNSNSFIPENTVINNIAAAAFGVDLFVPVNGYQKTMRSVKYAILCILLTFAAFFLIEINNKKSVHPFHYGLIGLTLILFYVLLLSFSEYIGFNFSYVIASVCTISLIAWFVKAILSSGRLAILLAVILMLTYTYIFTILQLQDYSLLMGSIGLFITLGIIMYYSRKIKW